MQHIKITAVSCLVALILLLSPGMASAQAVLQQGQKKAVIDTLLQGVNVTMPKKAQIDKSKLATHIPWNLVLAGVENLTLSAYVDTQFVLLTWSYIEDATGYNLYRKQPGGSYKKINAKPILWPTDSKINLYDKLMPSVSYKLERAHIRAATNAEFYPNFTDQSKAQIFCALGSIYYQVSLIIGQAFADSTVKKGQVYSYKVKYLDDQGVENDFANEVTITAGALKALTKPSGLIATAGDSRILLLWNDPPATDTLSGYHVYRSTAAAGPFTRCNPTPVLSKVEVDINGDSLTTPQYGFLDTTVVNYTTYYYYIVPRNPLGRLGPKSAIVSAMPKDLTPPKMVPNLQVSPMKTYALALTWNWVTKDTRVPPTDELVKCYNVFRYTDYETAIGDTAASSSYLIATVTEPMSKPGVVILIGDTVRSYQDTNVEPEKVYWYRVSCTDTAGNVSKKSAALMAILPDYEPPDPPIDLDSEGFDDYIQISWQPPDVTKKENQDLAGYLIYRGICGGTHVKKDRWLVYQPYPLHLLADITSKDTLTYKDYSVPKGSPICYRYALKAYDKAQNLSAMSDSVCQRLQDKTPPETPIITALQARNNGIKIECVAAPIQDIKGFVVERSEHKHSGYQVVYSDSIPQSVTCADIPSSADSILSKKVNQLSFLDQNVEPEKTYWYQVRAFDHNGIKSQPSPPISTFTYEIIKLSKPDKLQAKDQGCNVKLTWNLNVTRYSPSFRGFVVFRSLNKNYGYRQVSAIVKDTQFNDDTVAPNLTYWYRVQAYDANGDRSPLSDPVSVTTKEARK